MQKLMFGVCVLLLIGCAPRLKPSFNPAVQPSATDFGPHGDPLEWWYLSGYLPEEKLAFHWAQFKVSPANIPTDVFLSHVAITDLTTGKVTFLEQQDNPSQGIGAGKVSYPPLKLQDGNWTFTQGKNNFFTLNAGPLKLKLAAQKPPVIHPPGYSGVPEITGGMYYQSITRLNMTGSIGQRPVKGVVWLDHQWGNMSVGKKALWDWMSIHMDNGEDLMIYRVLTAKGKQVQLLGSIVDQKGVARPATNIRMTPGRTWTSKTGRTYVLDWKIQADEFDLAVQALNDEQELLGKSTKIVYWEGPIQAKGTWRQQSVTGTGMMELVSGLTD